MSGLQCRTVIGWRSRHQSIDYSQKDQILDFLRDNPKSRSTEICTALCVDDRTQLQIYLFRLVSRGILIREGIRKNYLYSVGQA